MARELDIQLLKDVDTVVDRIHDDRRYADFGDDDVDKDIDTLSKAVCVLTRLFISHLEEKEQADENSSG